MHPLHKTSPFEPSLDFRRPLSFFSTDAVPRSSYFSYGDSSAGDDVMDTLDLHDDDPAPRPPYRKRISFNQPNTLPLEVDISDQSFPTRPTRPTRRSLLASLTAAASSDTSIPVPASTSAPLSRPRLRSTGSILAASTEALTLSPRKEEGEEEEEEEEEEEAKVMGSPEIDLSELIEAGMREREMKMVPSSVKKAGIVRNDRGSAGHGRGGSLTGAAAIFGTNRENFALRARREIQSSSKLINRKSSIPRSPVPVNTPSDLDFIASTLATPPPASRPHARPRSMILPARDLCSPPAPTPISCGKRPGRHSVLRSLTASELLRSSSPPSDDIAYSPPPMKSRRTLSMMGTREFLGEEVKEFCGEKRGGGRERERERGREREIGVWKDDSKVEEDEAMDEEELSPEVLSWHESRGGALLPCFEERSQDVLKRITSETLIALLDGTYLPYYDTYYIIDCRFPYEYDGGHIQGAVNINTTDAIERLLLAGPKVGVRTLLVFHCEFSAHRAPKMALHLRNRDRQLNMSRYPYLHYPELYILKGGYSTFFQHFKERCNPQRYIEMKDERHREDFRQLMGTTFRKRVVRSKSFTEGFGVAAGAGAGRIITAVQGRVRTFEEVVKATAEDVESAEGDLDVPVDTNRVGGGLFKIARGKTWI